MKMIYVKADIVLDERRTATFVWRLQSDAALWVSRNKMANMGLKANHTAGHSIDPLNRKGTVPSNKIHHHHHLHQVKPQRILEGL